MNEEKKKSKVPMIIGIGCLVVMLLGVVGVGGCFYFGKMLAEKAFDGMGTVFSTQAESEEDSAALQEKFEKVKALGLPWLQKTLFLSIVGTRINDQTITAEEAELLHEVMDECIDKGADVSLQHFLTVK